VRRRGILIALGLVVVAAAAFAVSRRAGEAPKPTPTPVARTPAPTATPSPPPPAPAAGTGLQLGITEFNPNLIGTDPALLQPFARWRDALAELEPHFFRLVIDWRAIQPQRSPHADLTAYNGGCARDVPPCAPYGGLRDMLKALAARQRQDGWQVLAVITGTPDWAAADPSGCERPKDGPSARAPREDALPAYRQLVTDVLAAARQEHATLTYWSAWNEPNLHQFLSPQRATCSRRAPSEAPAGYAKLFFALRQALDAAPGEQREVVGETAGVLRSGAYTTSVAEFIAGLPKDVVCGSAIWSQHGYVGGPDPVRPVLRALDARDCDARHTVWITETGVVAARSELSEARAITDDQRGCHQLHRRLVQWWREPRVTAAFQYELRDDPPFPSGLVTTDLRTARPELAEWTAWGHGRDPAAAPPAATC
jgi:hypothetical protein